MIDDKLMADAIKASGCKTKREVVEEGLRLVIRRSEQQQLRDLRGKLTWEGSLDVMRGKK